MRNISINEILQKDANLKGNKDGIFSSILDIKRGCLNGDGKSDIKYTLKGELLKDFEKIEKDLFLSESLDPKKEYLPQKYFYKTHVFDKVEEIFTKVIEDDNRIYFLRGARSIGKTLSQNIYLKENDKRLETEKIFWVRCDCKKIIDILRDRNISFENIDNSVNFINDYLNIQFLYVFAKYYNDDQRAFFRKIFDEIATFEIEQRSSKSIFNLQSKKVTIRSEIEEINKNIWHFKRTRADETFHYGREIIFGLGLKKENKATMALDKWRSLSVQIQQKMNDLGYKILKIIDGIDNYSKYDYAGEYSAAYKFLLEKIYKCHIDYERTKQNKNESIIVMLRSNTYYDYITNHYNIEKKENVNPRIYDDEIKKNSIEEKDEILKRRYFFLNEKYRNSHVFSIFQLVIENKNDNTYLNAFLGADKHVGYYLRNNLSLIPALIYYQKKYDMSVEKLILFFKNYQGVNLLLNGFFALDSFDKESGFIVDIGKMLFNIFYFESQRSNNKKWQGLCCTRIIQHLIAKGRTTKEALIEDIKYLFGYDEFEIKKKISKLLFYSIIRLDKKVDGEDISPNLLITEKGKIVLDLIYSDVDILYHCALDTPLPSNLIEQSYIQPHNNDMYVKNYAISSLKSSITFIQYLKKINMAETKTLNKKAKARYNPDDYSLPLLDNDDVIERLTNRLQELYSSLKDTKLIEFNSFMAKIF
ncbi:hypothetical protein IR083_07305 [Dysgonomonas sp. GY75]|uniref:hypothetical protein n=1 Tax=Dysgonomonas sp. GY75 TaxID=2780419 RepID=UPI0018844B40|nr:hypothetical protein [Dysgonomonas sp. GY75]MBF0648622.1 hypothetical protein [Dysgonomonas sp. GY75]